MRESIFGGRRHRIVVRETLLVVCVSMTVVRVCLVVVVGGRRHLLVAGEAVFNIAAYEAGYFGFTTQRMLTDQGVDCLVIHPSDIPTTHKEKDQKRDPIDSRKIARSLRAGQIRSIWVPPVTVSQDRRMSRIVPSMSAATQSLSAAATLAVLIAGDGVGNPSRRKSSSGVPKVLSAPLASRNNGSESRIFVPA